MSSQSVYNCPACNTMHTTVLATTTMLVCKNCGEVIVFEDMPGTARPTRAQVPDDWSFLQTGTTGAYKGEDFVLRGRIRLQLRNDYKNFWCASLMHGKHLWLMESFASMAVLTPSWNTFNRSVQDLHAGASVKMTQNLTLKGEYVEKCEGVSYEGEIGNWKRFYPGFFFIQGSTRNGATGVFLAGAKQGIEYLLGEKVTADKLNLKNIITWNEWK